MKEYPKAPNGDDTGTYLRQLVNYINNTNEDLVMRYTPIEWLALFDAYHACGWDYTADHWSKKQRARAISCRVPPSWTRKGKPAKRRCAGFYIDGQSGHVRPCTGCNMADYCDEGALDEFLAAHAAVGLKEGWAIFNAHEGRAQIQKEDLREDGGVPLPSDADAYPLAAKALSKLTGAWVGIR